MQNNSGWGPGDGLPVAFAGHYVAQAVGLGLHLALCDDTIRTILFDAKVEHAVSFEPVFNRQPLPHHS
jgi:hypothetical protein